MVFVNILPSYQQQLFSVMIMFVAIFAGAADSQCG